MGILHWSWAGFWLSKFRWVNHIWLDQPLGYSEVQGTGMQSRGAILLPAALDSDAAPLQLLDTTANCNLSSRKKMDCFD
jgi:hypothetical protein